ncbi:MAG: transketolase C-terminal domain-containing protein [Candidatus Xenobia bacterium]
MIASVLRQLRSPGDVNYLTDEDMQLLCEEMRQVDGGLGAGVAELAVALHRGFDVPPDVLSFGDASILRACELLGASYGPPDADCIGTAIGRARARDLKRQKQHVVAVDSHPFDRRLSGRERTRLIVVHMRPITGTRARSSFLPTRRKAEEAVDARRLPELLAALEEAREASGLSVIEVLVEPSRRRREADPVALSGPIASYKEVLAQTLFELARQGQRFVWVGPHAGPLGREYPERFVEWESGAEHGLAVASALGAEEIPAIVMIRSSEVARCLGVLQRRIAGPGLPVTVVIDEDDGELEVAALRVLPGVSIFSPADENDLRSMVVTALSMQKPVAICCPRGQGVGVKLFDLPREAEPPGRAERLSEGRDVAILALGRAVYPAILAAQKLTGYGIEASVVNMRSVRPLDEALLKTLVDEGIYAVLTVEEGTLVGGMGAAVMESLHRRGISAVAVRALGREENPLATGLLGPHDPDAIVAGVLAFVSPKSRRGG